MSWYTIIVLDADGCTVTQTEEASLKAAKLSAREKLDEPCYDDGIKVEIHDESGVCVWDKFKQSRKTNANV